jgi:hypothetical protein
MKQLGSTHVPDVLYQMAHSVSRSGGKVFLVIGDVPPDIPPWSTECGNCNGQGVIGLQYFTGGPYDSAPTIQNHLPNAQRPNDVPARATIHNGKWYKQKTRTESCPICQGTGIGQRKQKQLGELAL